MIQREKLAAIITAAGESRRMHGVDKIFVPLGGRPLLSRSLDVFARSSLIRQIIVVVHPSNLDRARELVATSNYQKNITVCAGGSRRQDSVKNGLAHIKNADWVLIHDGARPFVTETLVKDGLAAAQDTGAAIAAVPVTDTIKQADDRQVIQFTLPRENLWAIQTPQVFRFDIISQAYRLVDENATDDSALAEKAGFKVKVYNGSYDNIKITTPSDLALAEVLLKKNVH